jgi:hypothetical protein
LREKEPAGRLVALMILQIANTLCSAHHIIGSLTLTLRCCATRYLSGLDHPALQHIT